MDTSIGTVGIMPHAQKERSLEVACQLLAWLEEQGVAAKVMSEDARAMGCPDKGVSGEAFLEDLDLLVSLGGDGAMLRAAALAYGAAVPVVGINMGKKGFLTAMEAEGMYPAMEDILAGRFLVQERMLLECTLEEEGFSRPYYALNEIAVGKRELQRMIRLEVHLDGRYFHFYAGDGVIFSTPTGSTAYSLSAGGPIADPLLDCIILTPICSHSLLDRSVIISGREEIEMPRGGKVRIRRANRRLKMIKLESYSFFGLLREKFDFPGNDIKTDPA